MDLLAKEIDEKETVKRTQRFLDKDFQEIRTFAGISPTDLSSPILDPSGVSNHSNTNNQDIRFINYGEQYNYISNCQKTVKAVMDAIESCSNGPRQSYGTLLYKRYIKYDYDLNVYTDLDWSSTKYYKARRKALIEFAQILPVKLLKYKAGDDEFISLVPDLLAFQK